jgi:hypothetical protein
VGDENFAESTEYDGFGAKSVIFRTLADALLRRDRRPG